MWIYEFLCLISQTNLMKIYQPINILNVTLFKVEKPLIQEWFLLENSPYFPSAWPQCPWACSSCWSSSCPTPPSSHHQPSWQNSKRLAPYSSVQWLEMTSSPSWFLMIKRYQPPPNHQNHYNHLMTSSWLLLPGMLVFLGSPSQSFMRPCMSPGTSSWLPACSFLSSTSASASWCFSTSACWRNIQNFFFPGSASTSPSWHLC